MSILLCKEQPKIKLLRIVQIGCQEGFKIHAIPIHCYNSIKSYGHSYSYFFQEFILGDVTFYVCTIERSVSFEV